MKMRFRDPILFLIGIVLLASCEEGVRFETPQPEFARNLRVFPKKMRGRYYSSEDSVYLEISKQMVVKERLFKFQLFRPSVQKDSQFRFDGDFLIDLENDIRVRAVTENDSVRGVFGLRDTIFITSGDQVLRKLKGHYFLNSPLGPKEWKVEMVSLDKDGKLILSKISEQENFERLSDLTELEEIRTSDLEIIAYKLKPTKNELKKLIESSFKERLIFRKIE